MKAAFPPNPPEDDAVLAAEDALGLLGPEEARAFARRRAAEPALGAERAAWDEALAGLAPAPVAPPAGVERAIAARLFEDADAPRRAGPLAWLALLGTPTAAALLLIAFFQAGPDTPSATALEARIAAEDESLALRAQARGATLRVALQGGAARPGRVLELWLIAGEAGPVSLGLLPEAGILELAVPKALTPGAVLAVSDEPPGGSPTGAPTGAVLATGVVAPA